MYKYSNVNNLSDYANKRPAIIAHACGGRLWFYMAGTVDFCEERLADMLNDGDESAVILYGEEV